MSVLIVNVGLGRRLFEDYSSVPVRVGEPRCLLLFFSINLITNITHDNNDNIITSTWINFHSNS